MNKRGPWISLVVIVLLLAGIWLAKKAYSYYSRPKNFNQEHAKFQKLFPDGQSIQLPMARKHGVKAMQKRGEVPKNKGLKKVKSTREVSIRPASYSQHYLVPRAQKLLEKIGKDFADSLEKRDLKYERIVATSLTRTREDVDKLRKSNGNAVYNSAHMHGTTFDLSYRRWNKNPKLKKEVLSNTLKNLRASKRCYVKYEVQQSCFHITTR